MVSEKFEIEQEINNLMDLLGKSLKVIETTVSERDQKISQIKKSTAQRVMVHRLYNEEVGKRIYNLFKANKALLTDNGRNKVLKLELGEIGTRLSRPSVWAKNIGQLKETFAGLGLIRFIKVKKEYSLDKIAMAAEPKVFENIKEVSITQKEFFFVKTIATEEEYQKEIKKIRLN